MNYDNIEFVSDFEVGAEDRGKYIETVRQELEKQGVDASSLEKIRLTAKNSNEAMVEYRLRNGPKFERIRRITGYLVGTTERWNDSKRAELKDRIKHG